MILVGIDWSEKWHDVCLMDESGQVLASDGWKTRWPG